MLEALKIKVWETNRSVGEKLEDGFCSAIDRETGLIVLAPRGVDIEKLSYEDMLVVDCTGEIVEGDGDITHDAFAHIEIYSELEEISSIVEASPTYAAAFAQAKRNIPVYGAYHGSRYLGAVPCIDLDSANETSDDDKDFEQNVGADVVAVLKNTTLAYTPACLVASLGLLAFGTTTDEALKNAIAAEKIARLAYVTEMLGGEEEIPFALNEKLFLRRRKR